jgi:hypothetical protein
VCYGYNHNEVAIPQLINNTFIVKGKTLEIDPTFKITGITKCSERPTVLASLGCHVRGACLPHPNPKHTDTVILGSMYRFCRKIEFKMPPEFGVFVETWIRQNLKPLSNETDRTFETWLNNTPYTQARKTELAQVRDEFHYVNDLSSIPDKEMKKILKVKSFIKDETYPEYKHARAINSRSDIFKCLVGPLVQCISNVVFSMPWFIKKIPVNERPNYIIDNLLNDSCEYLLTDYTSFEAHFTKDMQEACELKLFEYMTSQLPEGTSWFNFLKRAKTSTNHIHFNLFKMNVEAKRMSGEMDTSLSNGFSNLMFMLFTLSNLGYENHEINGIVEGDDGVFTLCRSPPNQAIFDSMGLNIKILKTAELSHASFCGMVFDLVDQTIIADPIEKLVSIGWTNSKYAASRSGKLKCLLRSKALSCAYQYPSCPILSVFAKKIYVLTQGHDVQSFINKHGSRIYDQHHLHLVQEAIKYFQVNEIDDVPKERTRLLVEELYGVTVAHQLKIEEYIRSMTTIQSIECDVLNDYLRQDWIDYYNRYSHNAIKSDLSSSPVNSFGQSSGQPNYGGFLV